MTGEGYKTTLAYSAAPAAVIHVEPRYHSSSPHQREGFYKQRIQPPAALIEYRRGPSLTQSGTCENQLMTPAS